MAHLKSQQKVVLLILTFLLLGFSIGGCSSSSEKPGENVEDELIEVEGEEGGDVEEFGAEEEDAVEELAEDEEADEEADDFAAEDEEAEDDLEDQAEGEDLALEDELEDSEDESAEGESSLVADDQFSNLEPVDIKNIEYKKPSKIIVVTTSGVAQYSTRFKPDTNQYVIEIQNSSLPESLKRPFILKEFDSPFGAINAYQTEGATISRIVVQMKSAFEPTAQQEGNTLIVIPEAAPTAVAEEAPEEPKKEVKIELAPKDKWKESYDTVQADKDEKVLAAKSLEEFLTESNKFYGRRISIQTKEADIRDVINFIAEESGINLVLSEDVKGKISLKLRQVPWDQALIISMRAMNLGYIRQGNVLRISKLTALQAEAESAKKIIEAQKTLTPLRVKVIPVSYAKVEDLEKQIKPFLTGKRGQIVSDARTSSLVITDTNDILQKVQRLIGELDIPPAQVMIEGKIVEASESFRRDIGVNWSFSGAPVTLSETGGFQGQAIQLTPSFSSQPLGTSAFANSLGLDIGTLDVVGSLSAFLSLAESEALVKVISSPRVVTINKEKASIKQTTEVVAIKETVDDSGNKARSTVKSPIVLELEVTPQITASGSVIMEVTLKRDFAGAIVDQELRDRPVNTREAKTKILVNNGQTAVIGGVYQSDETSSESGFPGLRKIPILGWLFKSKGIERTKTELLLFLTPRILNAKEQSIEEAEEGKIISEDEDDSELTL